MKTKFGIYLDLASSDYIVETSDLKLYFSSKFNKDRFNNKIAEYIYQETIKFYNKYKVNVDLNKIFAISLYKTIEKRGFRIDDKKGVIDDNKIIKL